MVRIWITTTFGNFMSKDMTQEDALDCKGEWELWNGSDHTLLELDLVEPGNVVKEAAKIVSYVPMKAILNLSIVEQSQLSVVKNSIISLNDPRLN